ncbi:MAG: glycosyltransferase family 39 protein [Thermoguttaceae bacterium]|nr:glycosyltransferase family 39 protein [Thermoguttaceae bacterium]
MKGKMRIFAWVAVVVVYLSTLLYSVYYCASNYDETANIVAGIMSWKTGRFDVYQVNPPLYKLVAAAPTSFYDSRLDWKTYYGYTTGLSPTSRPEFRMALDFAQCNREKFHLYLILARLACLPFALLGAYFTWRWASELFDRRAGFVALIFWAFCPNILTGSASVLPDLPATSLGVMFGYYFWRWVKSPNWRDVCWLGLVLGAVWLTKFTWVILVPLAPTIWLACFALGSERTRRAFFSQLSQLVVVFLIGAFVLNLGYGFDGSFKPLGEYKFCCRTLAGSNFTDYNPETDGKYEGGNRFKGTAFESIPVPVPENYLKGIDLQKYDFERGLPSYFNGEWSDHGWKLFYWECAAFKIPLGAQALFFAACVLAFRGELGQDRRAWMRDVLCLLAPGLTLFVFVSLQSGFSRHFRYVLPALPCVYIFASSVFAEKNRSTCLWGRALAYGCLVWFVASALSVYPHSTSYFNELAGGPRNAWRYFLDSNLDWGQDTYALQDWLERRERKDVMLKLFDDLAEASVSVANYPRIPILDDQVPPEMIIDNERQIDKRLRGPRPGIYAIGVSELYGKNGLYRYLHELEPIDRIGYSFNIYEIDWDECNRLRAKYRLPPLTRPQTNQEQFFAEFCRRGQTSRPIRAAFIYYDKYDAGALRSFQKIFAETEETILERITPQQVRKEELERFDLIIAPGGQSGEQTQALRGEGATAIRQFVERGGGYFGVCAGAYLASTNEDYYLRLVNLRARQEKEYVPEVGLTSIVKRQPGRVELSLTNKGAELFQCDRETKLKNVFYFTGPFFQPGYQSDLPEAITLSVFDTEVADYDFQRGTMIGAPAIAIAPFGEGNVVVTSPHLEENAEFYPYLRTLLLGATRERTPESKGALYCFPND